MKNLSQYFNKTKIESSPREADFIMLLSKLETKTEIKNNFYINTNTYAEKVKSPFFAWSFGFAGFSMAALMFFINTNTEPAEENLALSSTVIMKSTNSTVDKQSVSDAIDLIDNMESFTSVAN